MMVEQIWARTTLRPSMRNTRVSLGESFAHAPQIPHLVTLAKSAPVFVCRMLPPGSVGSDRLGFVSILLEPSAGQHPTETQVWDDAVSVDNRPWFGEMLLCFARS